LSYTKRKNFFLNKKKTLRTARNPVLSRRCFGTVQFDSNSIIWFNLYKDITRSGSVQQDEEKNLVLSDNFQKV
jgi:hypothetical protein